MTATALSRFLDDGRRSITLVESDAIGTVGVGEATIPPIRAFNQRLGLDEDEFIRRTGATIKLGIEFTGWGAQGDSYIHPFGQVGRDIEGVGFHQLWLKHRAALGNPPFDSFAIAVQAAARHRFTAPSADPRSPLSGIDYAYHFDAGLYAAYLRERAEAHGVVRVEGAVASVDRDGTTGHVTALTLEDGRSIAGDLFIDCSGFRSLLLGETMGAPFEDWSHWLMNDRAIAMPCERTGPLRPITRAAAHDAGWQWRIPLQHRTGNGIVYASAMLDDDAAEARLRAGLDAPPTGDPRLIRFTTGMRRELWVGNVVGIGLSSGFLEPLESTSLHLIQTGISRLLWLFPDCAMNAVERDEYNRSMREQFEYVRDFIILHYIATRRDDSAYWRAMGALTPPDSLAEKLELFRQKGRVRAFAHDLFAPPSWHAVLLGQGIVPDGYDPLADGLDDTRVVAAIGQWTGLFARVAEQMPGHADYLNDPARRYAG